jgi:hypothetical protein
MVALFHPRSADISFNRSEPGAISVATGKDSWSQGPRGCWRSIDRRYALPAGHVSNLEM